MKQDFAGQKILLGICGGIAAYKTAVLVRELTQLGAIVRVVITESAMQFVTQTTLQALSGQAVHTSLWDADAARAMNHIELARWADYVLIAPASAHCIAQLACGLASDLLTTLALVIQVPLIIAPAMNQAMWSHPATQQNICTLQQRGVMIIGPTHGEQACGEVGLGCMLDPLAIIDSLRVAPCHKLLMGATILITAGPTYEAIDPVRFIANRSSGKMGYALACAAKCAGANVILISGPTNLRAPDGVIMHKITTAQEMLDTVNAAWQADMIFIACAAVADYRPTQVITSKIKKYAAKDLNISCTQNHDIVSSIAMRGDARYIIGFAAETDNLIIQAQQKRIDKGMDMILANQVGESVGFDVDVNQITLITATIEKTFVACHKMRLAAQIINNLAEILHDNSYTA